MESILSKFIEPALDYVDSGKFFRQPFKWLFYIIGILTFAIPVLMLLSFRLSSYMSAGDVFCTTLLLLVWLIVAWIVCLIWFIRARNLNVEVREGQRFIAFPLVAAFVQTMGEAGGVLVGVGGFFTVLLLKLFDSWSPVFDGYYSWWFLLCLPICGYLCVLLARFMAESILAIANIANNTESINKKINC